ncbi:hypothetical protein fugu_015294 [Takifugu bimaculatus]|uniref:Proline-rich AKT1 substrate 1 N-terminal domain-containing protein n=1 Tax=Takifugu bimaculatus TaxID=433685 RepID=A0A4Z2BZF8_9TELE|nr:hypothetical protein fugu_015294 [Takifugu bimaculatus]
MFMIKHTCRDKPKQQLHEDASSGQEAGSNTCTRVQARTSPPIALCHVFDVRSDWSQSRLTSEMRQVRPGKTTAGNCRYHQHRNISPLDLQPYCVQSASLPTPSSSSSASSSSSLHPHQCNRQQQPFHQQDPDSERSPEATCHCSVQPISVPHLKFSAPVWPPSPSRLDPRSQTTTKKAGWRYFLLRRPTARSQGCDLAILTACKKFPSAEGHRKRESGGVFPKECDFSYSVWGQGFLAESARRYVDDISVLHSTTMLMAQKHTRQAEEGGAKLPAEPGSEPGHVSSSTGDGGVGGVSPSSRMFSQSYPSIYSSGAVSRRGGGHAGEKERERGSQEAQRGRQRSGIVDVDEACEDEEEDEEEEEDEQRAYGNESAGVFSMDEDSLSRDCEPFWSDGEEESTDGSLSEDAPPPPRGIATGQPAYLSRQVNAMALARSLPVSVPAWGFRGTRDVRRSASAPPQHRRLLTEALRVTEEERVEEEEERVEEEEERVEEEEERVEDEGTWERSEGLSVKL